MAPVWEVAPHPQATAKERPGSFREHDIEPFPGGMRPPDWTQVPMLIRDWVGDAQALPTVDAADLPEALARLHARFEQVHPFLDGNGRAGRLVLNLFLVRLGYPPAIIYKGNRLATSLLFSGPTRGISVPSGSSSRGRSWTNSTSSSSLRLPDRPGSCRCRRWRPRSSRRTRSAWPRRGDG